MNMLNLEEIEDSDNAWPILDALAKAASISAVREAYEQGISITYLEENQVVEVNSNGLKRILFKVEQNRCRVKIGDTIRLDLS